MYRTHFTFDTFVEAERSASTNAASPGAGSIAPEQRQIAFTAKV
jgi:hypothetical protein